MRTCMYCGRELKDNEICNCSMSVARRQAKAKAEQSEPSGSESEARTDRTEGKKSEQTAYKTGYAGGDNRFERAREKARAKRAAKKNAARNAVGHKHEFWGRVLSRIKNPLDAVLNPKSVSKSAMLLGAAVTGAMLWLSIFFARGNHAGIFGLLASAMGFVGDSGYRLITSMIAYILSGALSGIIIFFLYTGIFYFISRVIMRCRSGYWYLCERLVAAWIPFLISCAAGVIVSLLSPYVTFGLVMCGALTTVLLTYEGLKVEWADRSPVKIVYSIPLGFFIFFWIMLRIALAYSTAVK